MVLRILMVLRYSDDEAGVRSLEEAAVDVERPIVIGLMRPVAVADVMRSGVVVDCGIEVSATDGGTEVSDAAASCPPRTPKTPELLRTPTKG